MNYVYISDFSYFVLESWGGLREEAWAGDAPGTFNDDNDNNDDTSYYIDNDKTDNCCIMHYDTGDNYDNYDNDNDNDNANH